MKDRALDNTIRHTVNCNFTLRLAILSSTNVVVHHERVTKPNLA